MLKSIFEWLVSAAHWLLGKPAYALPVTVIPLALVFIALLLIWLWLIVTKPIRRLLHG